MLLLLSAAGGVLVTALQMAGLPTIGVLTVELLVITAVTWYCLRDKLNLCLFLIFFYEVGVGLWDFLLQAGLGIMFRSENFINPNAMEYLAGIWLVRLLMLIGSITLIKQEHPNAGTLRALSVLVILGMFGAVTLSEQTILPLNEDQVGTWIIVERPAKSGALFNTYSTILVKASDISLVSEVESSIKGLGYNTCQSKPSCH